MEDNVRAEFEKLKKEIDDLKKKDVRKERLIRKLSSQLNTNVKQLRSVKEATRRNSSGIDSLKSMLRNILRNV